MMTKMNRRKRSCFYGLSDCYYYFSSYCCLSSFDDVVTALLNFGSRMLRGSHVQGFVLQVSSQPVNVLTGIGDVD
jgi:hypothetical protein